MNTITKITAQENNTYWDSNGRYQDAIDALQARVPAEGPVKHPGRHKALERFRVASNCYYDLYNNGLCNRAAQFNAVFEIRAKSRMHCHHGRYGLEWTPEFYACVEEKMDAIVAAAAEEQGLGYLIVRHEAMASVTVGL